MPRSKHSWCHFPAIHHEGPHGGFSCALIRFRIARNTLLTIFSVSTFIFRSSTQFLTLRRLNIEIQGFPESYAAEPLDMCGAEAHPQPPVMSVHGMASVPSQYPSHPTSSLPTSHPQESNIATSQHHPPPDATPPKTPSSSTPLNEEPNLTPPVVKSEDTTKSPQSSPKPVSDGKEEPPADVPLTDDACNGIKNDKTGSNGSSENPAQAKDDGLQEVDSEKNEDSSKEDAPNKKQKVQ